jgi:diadenylate cyclase
VVNLFSAINFIDIADILCLWALLYFGYRFISQRRAAQLAIGLILFALLVGFCNLIGLNAMSAILSGVLNSGWVLVFIIFQPEIRAALEKMGGKPLQTLKTTTEKTAGETMAMINEICDAVFDMAKTKTGAIIVFERSTKLGDLVLTGTVINANASSFLIKNIFFNKAPLHDGALIIRDNRLHAAGCLLPLSTNSDIIKDLGTRHRAAIGMSENSDAVVVVVSEETGIVSIAIDGVLKRNFTRISMKRKLEEQLVKESSHRDASHRGFIVKS